MRNIGAAGLVILLVLLGGSRSWGQEPARSFDELQKRVSIGDSVRVTDAAGKIVKGKVKEMSSSSLRLSGSSTVLSADSVRRIEKQRKDSLWNGLLIGGAAGVAGGAIAARSQCTNDSECSAIANVVFIPTGLAIGMVAGALIDRSMTRFETVFTGQGDSGRLRVRISPIMARQLKGLSLSVNF